MMHSEVPKHSLSSCVPIAQDFLGGHIRGAVNISSDKWEDDDDVENTIREHLPGKDTVILHCALSQVRGPFCADRYTCGN